MEKNDNELTKIENIFFIACIIFWFVIAASLIVILKDVKAIYAFLNLMGYG